MSVVGRPDQVHNCTITNISMTSLGIRCIEGFNGGLAQSFMLEVRDMGTQVSLPSNCGPWADIPSARGFRTTHFLPSLFPFFIQIGNTSQFHIALGTIRCLQSASWQLIHCFNLCFQCERTIGSGRIASRHVEIARKAADIGKG